MWCDVGRVLSGFVLFVVHQKKAPKTQHRERMSGISSVHRCGYLCHGLAHLSNLQCCSVLLFTAIEGMHNGLGRVFDIHHGETVGFP